MKPIIVHETFEVVARLSDFDLTVANLLAPVKAGYSARVDCTDLDPPIYPGLTMFSVAVRQLRIELIPKGWTQCDGGNYSRTISADKRLGIGVALGDSATGVPGLSPSTQSPKGAKTMQAVAANVMQLHLDLEIPDGFESIGNHVGFSTWLLLVHMANEELRAELSHPLAFDDSKRVCVWRERIILPRVPIEPADQIDIDAGEGVDVNVPVHRRA